jgi:CheY-like chemotaxis protein
LTSLPDQNKSVELVGGPKRAAPLARKAEKGGYSISTMRYPLPSPSTPAKPRRGQPVASDGHRDPPGILVADDDSTILNLLQLVLQGKGFRVWAAASGEQAVELYEHNQRHIGVVLLDVRMAGLDGPAILARLQRLNPRVVACFMSGYTGQYTPEDLLRRGAAQLIDKPFRMEETAELLWQLAHLEAPPPTA